MVKHEEDFVNENVVQFKIGENSFAFKPTTAGDETDWMDEYMEIGEDKKPKQNLARVTRCKFRNLVQVPYGQEIINKIIGVDKTWEQLDKAQRWAFLRKLKPSVFTEIMNKINAIDLGSSKKKS